MTILSPLNDTYWHIQGYYIFWMLFLVALIIFTNRMWILLNLIRQGKKEQRIDHITLRLKTVLVEVLLGWCNLKRIHQKKLSEIGHSFMVLGFGLFAVGYIIFIGFGAGFGLFTTPSGSLFEKICFTILDVAGILLLIEIIWAFIKRYILKPARLEESSKEGGGLLLPLVLGLMLSLIIFHYCIVGFGYSVNDISGSWPPIGASIAGFLHDSGLSKTMMVKVYNTIWWANYIVIISFILYAPYSKHLHPLFSPANIFFRSLNRNKGILRSAKLVESETFGAGTIKDLSWKQRLDLFACTDCGRCQEKCPAYLTGKPLSPWKVIKYLRINLLHQIKDKNSLNLELVENVVASEEAWACTSCLACQEICPVLNEHLHTIMELRRNQVLEHARFPTELRKIFRNTEIYGDPLGMGKARRLDWARGEADVRVKEGNSYDYLIFVGCGSAFFDRNQEPIKILIQLLQANGFSVGVLGKEELCCGDPIRRAGNEFLFQELVRKNISHFERFEFKNIVTACPHCYNTLKFEYPDFGGSFEVLHHTQLLHQLFEEGRLELKNKLNRKVVYHDPCYLGRYNGIYDSPRQLIDSIDGVERIEMKRSRENSFCCGGGGGRFWMEEKIGQNINQVRLEEVLEQSPEMIITACPFCASMFDDALSLKEEKLPIRVMDILQLIKEAGGQSA